MYGIHLELSVRWQEVERGAIEIALRSRRAARAEETLRWAAEEERRAGREPRSSSFRARAIRGVDASVGASCGRRR